MKYLIELILVALGISFVYLGTLLSESSEHWLHLTGLGLEHLGIGFFAVTILKVFVEEASQKEWVRGIKEAVQTQIKSALAPLTYRIIDLLGPEALQSLEESFFNLDFIRPEFDLTLELQPITQRTDLVKCDVTLKYTVTNVATERKAYPVTAWLDDIVRISSPAPQITAGFTEIKLGSSSQDISYLMQRHAIYSNDGVIHLHLEDKSIEPKESLKVTVSGTQIMRKEDHFVWNLATVTQKMSLTIKLAGELTFEKSRIYPRAMHHMDESLFTNSVKNIDLATKTFTIGQVLLPFQGVEVRWLLNS